MFNDLGKGAPALQHAEKAHSTYVALDDKTSLEKLYPLLIQIYLRSHIKTRRSKLVGRTALATAVYGQHHYLAESACDSLATIYSRRGELAQSLEFAQLALNLRSLLLGRDHSDVAQLYNTIAASTLDKALLMKPSAIFCCTLITIHLDPRYRHRCPLPALPSAVEFIKASGG